MEKQWTPHQEEVKQHFIDARGAWKWSAMWDTILELDPEIVDAYADYSSVAEKRQVLDVKMRKLMAQYSTIKEGAPAVPYHADGELCRMYPAEEFASLAQAATAHVFYHRTYCNHLNVWIRRAGLEELAGITM